MSPPTNETVNMLVFRGKFQPFYNTMRTSLFSLMFLLFGFYGSAQELVGPDHISSGTLASFEIMPAQEASWHIVTPTQATETYQVDTSSSKLYFASPVRGNYTVIAGIVVEGKSELLVKTFANGTEDDDKSRPNVSSLEIWVKTQTPILVKSKEVAKESRLVADCFEQIVRRIENENIKTASNAQTQLQIALTATLSQASPTAVTDWLPFLTELSRRLEQELGEKTDDLAEMKRVIQNVGNALKSLEIPALKTPLPSIDDPRTRGSQNRMFRNFLPSN